MTKKTLYRPEYVIMNRNFIINFGPQHPAAHGVLRLILESNDERIFSLDPHIGFLHRGTEKLIESKPYFQALPYFDRLDYVSMLAQEHGYVLAVESIINLPLSSTRIAYIRVIFDELTRLLNHLMCITTHALDVGAMTPFLLGFEEREKLMHFYEFVSGARMHAAYYWPGSVAGDISTELLEKVYDFVNGFEFYIDALEDLLTFNRIWINRLKGVGEFSRKEVLERGFTGPVARSTGVPFDIRLTQPYSDYNLFNFNIPLVKQGDSYSRYCIRVEEMRESVKIIHQCLQKLTFQAYNFHNLRDYYDDDVEYLTYNLNQKRNVKHKAAFRLKSSMEEVILKFKADSLGGFLPTGKSGTMIEAPKGETGVNLLCSGSEYLSRCKIRAPGFYHIQGVESGLDYVYIADLVSIIGSLDVVFGEIDR